MPVGQEPGMHTMPQEKPQQLTSSNFGDDASPRADSPSSSVWNITSLPSLRPSGLERMSLTWMFL